ncbi:MAG: hypothetical protein H6627_00270 [Calditrichae bacterium]|nr:hypothetical protein [Calditrichota bacterium]MCB9056973.1 hypothetical protein [Calditrichia bacterium]
MKFNKLNILKIFLYLVAVHSFLVGVNLIVFPTDWMQLFGFGTITENFFKVQGGVFHIVMAVAYVLAGWRPIEYKILIVFSIAAKFLATAFLFSYFLIINPAWMILISGFGDFSMAMILLYLYKTTKELQTHG